jgi:hypothetical protein
MSILAIAAETFETTHKNTLVTDMLTKCFFDWKYCYWLFCINRRVSDANVQKWTFFIDDNWKNPSAGITVMGNGNSYDYKSHYLRLAIIFHI